MKIINRFILTGLLLALASCGQSVEQKHEKIVACTGFSLGLQYDERLLRVIADKGIKPQDTATLFATGIEYSKRIDPARAAEVSKEGALAAKAMVEKKDDTGIANYLADCVATFKDLGK